MVINHYLVAVSIIIIAGLGHIQIFQEGKKLEIKDYEMVTWVLDCYLYTYSVINSFLLDFDQCKNGGFCRGVKGCWKGKIYPYPSWFFWLV